MTQFRPCIDLHDGLVKQVIGGTFAEQNGQSPIENFVVNGTQDTMLKCIAVIILSVAMSLCLVRVMKNQRLVP